MFNVLIYRLFDPFCWLSGEDAPINDLVDFIIASQISVKLEHDVDTDHGDEDKEVCTCVYVT